MVLFNHVRTDNTISNLRWVTPSENIRNISLSHGHQFTFIDTLPDTAGSLDSYNGYDFDGLFIDYEEKKLYLFNGVRYRIVIPCRNKGSLYYNVCDIENKQRQLSHKVLFP